MTKKHFQALADLVRESEDFATQTKRARFACAMADVLAEQNPRFDRVRFLSACRPPWTVGAQGKHANPWERVIVSAMVPQS